MSNGGTQWIEEHTRCPPGKCIHKKKRKYPKKRRKRGQVGFI